MNRFQLLPAIFLAANVYGQSVSLKGQVLTVSGAPVSGAICQFKINPAKTSTDASGNFDFANSTVGIRKAEGYRVSMAAHGRDLSLNLDRSDRVAVDLFGISGKFLRNVVDADLGAGLHTLALMTPEGSNSLYLVRVRMGSQTAWHKLTLQGGIASITDAASASVTALSKSSAAADSLFCTSPDFKGGLAHINGRTVSSYSGTVNLRMFSTDPAWAAQCAMPVSFNFDGTAGATKYKQMIADPAGTEQEVLMEVCQATFKKANQPKKYTSYVANIKSGAGGQVAATGGNSLGFSTEYIANQPSTYAGWYELLGVQTHEATHSYQAYYNTTGASGFGEAMPDAVRALNGFFKWPTGTRCTGSFTDVYQTGGKYWYFIEMKHPGFLTSIWQSTAGDISTRVQTITGESLSAMVSECQTKGMP